MKKKFYKSIWFWVAIIAIVLSVVLFKQNWAVTNENEALISENKSLEKKYKDLQKAVVSAFGGDSSSDEESESGEDSEEATTNTKHAVNDEGELSSDGEKLLGLTLVSATKSFNQHGQNLIGDTSGLAITNENSVQLTFKYNNYAYEESWLPSIFDFTAYDKNGRAGTIVNQQDGQDEVAQGRSSQTTFWVNFKDATPAGSKIEIDYQGLDLDSPLTFTATVQ